MYFIIIFAATFSVLLSYRPGHSYVYNPDIVRRQSTCTDYIFDYNLNKYHKSVSNCERIHSGKILKIDSLDEWQYFNEAYDYIRPGSMFIGIKLPPNGNRTMNMTYEDGTPFNYTKYSIVFWDDVYNLGYGVSPLEKAYHYHGNGLVHANYSTWWYGVVCERLLNNTGLKFYSMNENILTSQTVLSWEIRDFVVSKVECGIRCAQYNSLGDACYGFQYSEIDQECNLSLHLSYTQQMQPIITESYYEESNSC